MERDIDLGRMLDELMEISMDCISYFGKNENLSEINMNEVKNDIEKAKENVLITSSKVYVLQNLIEKEISNELVMMYPESMFYYNLIDMDSRNGDKIDTGYPLKYMDEIVKYMANELDVNEWNGMKFDELCIELMDMRIAFRNDIMNRLYNGSNEYGVGWKNRCLVVNGNEYKLKIDCMKWKLSDLNHNEENERIEYLIDEKYESIIQALSRISRSEFYDYSELIENLDHNIVNMFINEDILDMTNDDVHHFFFSIYSPLLKYTILIGQEYDSYLKEWLGDYKWKLLYRASEHGYTAKSFHECCDDQGPTLVLIKSSEGCIFGGYTTQSWNSLYPNFFECIYNDMIFIFISGM